MLKGYFKLVQLPSEVRVKNKIKSKARLDCVAKAGIYKGLTNFVNNKGQLYFYKTPCRNYITTDRKRLAEWSLTKDSQNLSSIYIEDLDFQEIGYGYPNANKYLSNGKENPLFQFRNDAYLFKVNIDYSEIEIFIIPDGRNLINSYYQMMIDGQLDEEINNLRLRAVAIFRYEGLDL